MLLSFNEHPLRIGLSFGLTSGVIATLGLMVGLYSTTQSQLAVVGAILTISIADAFSDALGIHVSQETDSKYSLKEKKKALKDYPLWNKIIKDATEQSRNIFPTIIERPLTIKELLQHPLEHNSTRLCLATENVDSKYIKDIEIDDKPVYIAIGPEKGWSSTDIDIFKRLNFQFIKLKGNILRTETTGLVIGSIIKYIKGEI